MYQSLKDFKKVNKDLYQWDGVTSQRGIGLFQIDSCMNFSHKVTGEKITKYEFFWTKPIRRVIEFIARRILGSFTFLISAIVCAPLGFIAKIIHLGLDKMSQIWADESLYGHVLTSTSLKTYTFARSPLAWHLRSDGTDRRIHVIKYDDKNEIREEYKAEYTLIPFNTLEYIYKRFFGGCLTAASGVISPIGFVAKSIHFACKPTETLT